MLIQMDSVDPTICCNPDGSGEGACGGCFEFKTTVGLCTLDQYIKDKDPRAETMKGYPQCEGCSALWQRLLGKFCGVCKRKKEEQKENEVPSGTEDDDSGKLREAVRRRMQRGGSSTPPAPHPAAPKGTIRYISVYIVPNVPGTAAKTVLGQCMRNFPETMTMEDVFRQMIAAWNELWNASCKESLTIEYLIPRFSNNMNVDGTMLDTLGVCFDKNDRRCTPTNGTRKFIHGPPSVKCPGLFIFFEVIILVEKFEEEKNCLAPAFVHKEKAYRKRKSSEPGPLSMATALMAKRNKTDLPPSSLRSSFRAPTGSTKIKMVMATIKMGVDGIVEVRWPKFNEVNLKDVLEVVLQDTSFAHGESQKVYSLTLSGHSMVAKRFYNLHDGSDGVSMAENLQELELEAVRLSTASFFLQEFLTASEKANIDVQTNISVTKHHLAVEYFPPESTAIPSKASEVAADDYSTEIAALEEAPMVAWLLEPKRSTTVKKWSGSNQYPTWNNNKLGNTLNAFSHFVYIASHKELVIADLQTANARGDDGNTVHTLFDIIFHSPDSTQGLGDHGQDGINAFLNAHQCVDRCVQLRLPDEDFKKNQASSDEE